MQCGLFVPLQMHGDARLLFQKGSTLPFRGMNISTYVNHEHYASYLTLFSSWLLGLKSLAARSGRLFGFALVEYKGKQKGMLHIQPLANHSCPFSHTFTLPTTSTRWLVLMILLLLLVRSLFVERLHWLSPASALTFTWMHLLAVRLNHILSPQFTLERPLPLLHMETPSG